MPLLSQSALLNDGDVKEKNADGLCNAFVPNRNQLLITIAHAHAQNIGAAAIVTGINQMGESGYPDCSDNFMGKLEEVSNIGSTKSIHLLAPVLNFTKAQIWKMAERLGVLDDIIEHTITCYEGDLKFNEWGFGCGECLACKCRKEGYIEAKLSR